MKTLNKTEGQSRMDNPETLATLSTQNRGRRKNRKRNRWATRTPTKNLDWTQVLLRRVHYTCSVLFWC